MAGARRRRRVGVEGGQQRVEPAVAGTTSSRITIRCSPRAAAAARSIAGPQPIAVRLAQALEVAVDAGEDRGVSSAGAVVDDDRLEAGVVAEAGDGLQAAEHQPAWLRTASSTDAR